MFPQRPGHGNPNAWVCRAPSFPPSAHTHGHALPVAAAPPPSASRKRLTAAPTAARASSGVDTSRANASRSTLNSCAQRSRTSAPCASMEMKMTSETDSPVLTHSSSISSLENCSVSDCAGRGG
eukprot:176475-Chlamydomonas_euryale.AAC.1